jgi:hypothetical protein
MYVYLHIQDTNIACTTHTYIHAHIYTPVDDDLLLHMLSAQGCLGLLELLLEVLQPTDVCIYVFVCMYVSGSKLRCMYVGQGCLGLLEHLFEVLQPRCMYACMRVCMYVDAGQTYIHVHIPALHLIPTLHRCTSSCGDAYGSTNMHAHTHPCIHTYLHSI